MIHRFDNEPDTPDFAVAIDHRGGTIRVLRNGAQPERDQNETAEESAAHVVVLQGLTAAQTNAIIERLEQVAIDDGTLRIPTITISNEERDRAEWSGEQLPTSVTLPRPSQVVGAGEYRLTSKTSRETGMPGERYVASPNWEPVIERLSANHVLDTTLPRCSTDTATEQTA